MTDFAEYGHALVAIVGLALLQLVLVVLGSFKGKMVIEEIHQLVKAISFVCMNQL